MPNTAGSFPVPTIGAQVMVTLQLYDALNDCIAAGSPNSVIGIQGETVGGQGTITNTLPAENTRYVPMGIDSTRFTVPGMSVPGEFSATGNIDFTNWDNLRYFNGQRCVVTLTTYFMGTPIYAEYLYDWLCHTKCDVPKGDGDRTIDLLSHSYRYYVVNPLVTSTNQPGSANYYGSAGGYTEAL